MDGNGLPGAWRGKPCFTIAETGFGTGLNFLAAWTLFERTSAAGQQLHYISFEKYPLAWGDISRALAPWRAEFGGRIDRLRELYPLRVPGFHRVRASEQITLTLVFDDVNESLPQLDAPRGVDAWFLDGFAPSKNPDMWTDKLFSEMARVSAGGATFATFTVAGAVRRGLEAAGFAVEKKKGFGRKKEMLRGKISTAKRAPDMKEVRNVAIVGGGLAGTAAAFVLKRQGIAPVIFEKESALASGASGNLTGLYNPRLSAQRTAESDFYTAAFAQAFRTFNEIRRGHDVAFNPCSSLHLFTDADREKRLRGADENWGWHKTHLHLLDSAAASRRAGVTLGHGALALPDAGTISPAALCRAYADGIDLRLNETPDIETLCENHDAVILANGAAAAAFLDLPVHTVRGQVTRIGTLPEVYGLKTNLCFGGYLSPRQNGEHMLGATFQRWLDDCNVKDGDHEDNLRKLQGVLPGLSRPAVTGGRAGLRASSKDRFPVIGHLHNNIYVSTAHGSHGIVSSLAGAHLMADLMTGAPRSLSRATARALSPGRFAEREGRKQNK